MCQYFSHDYNARADIKMRRLQYDLGMWGVGTYWSLVEELYAAGNHLLTRDLPMIAKSFGTTLKKLMRVVNDYELFHIEQDDNGEFIYSVSVGKRLDLRKETAKRRDVKTEVNETQREKVSEARREAANKRWGKSKGAMLSDAKAMQNDAKPRCGAMQNNAEGMQNGDAKAMQNDAKPPYINIKDKRENIKTTTTSSLSQAREEERGLTASTPEPMTATSVQAELMELMKDENVQFQLHSKSGGMTPATIASLLPEFASQLQVTGGTEHGGKLVMHFAYWLGKKKTELEKRKRNGDYQERERQRFEETQRELNAYMLWGKDRPDWWSADNCSTVQPVSVVQNANDDDGLPPI